ncbi:MAG: response regulator [Bacteroidales bacterium]
MKKIKIVLVDDHNIVRDGFKNLLMNLTDIKVIGEASSGGDLFNLLKKIIPDIILMDITLPNMNGITITKKLKIDYPDIKVIMLTANVDDESVFDSFKAGALGYLPKNIQYEELVEAIREVAEGNEYVAKSISDVVLRNYFNRGKVSENKQFKSKHEITKRELQVIESFAGGFSYKEIADQLNISIHTVESHKKNILEKLELNSIVDLVKYAIKHGIINL